MPLASSRGCTKPEPQYLAITELVTSLVESYQREQRITHVSTAPLPSREAVIAILKLLREILFPGYFGRRQNGQDGHRDQFCCQLHGGGLWVNARSGPPDD